MEPTNSKKRVVLPGHHEGSLDLHQRKQGELPKGNDAQTKAQRDCGTAMEEGTQDMDLGQVDNDNRYSVKPFNIGKDDEDVYKNVDFGKMHDDFSLIKNASKKAGAGK